MVSRWLADRIGPFCDLKPVVLYNGIDLGLFRPDGPEPVPERPVLAWVGRFGIHPRGLIVQSQSSLRRLWPAGVSGSLMQMAFWTGTRCPDSADGRCESGPGCRTKACQGSTDR